jgi:hypothetical protein
MTLECLTITEHLGTWRDIHDTLLGEERQVFFKKEFGLGYMSVVERFPNMQGKNGIYA